MLTARGLGGTKVAVMVVGVLALLPVGAGCTRTYPGPPSAMSRLLELVNKSRAEHGVAPVQPCGPLGLAAEAHSRDMYDHNYLGHVGSDGSQPWDRAQRYGYGSGFVGENALGPGAETVEYAFLIWMNSPGHRQNILDPRYTHAGFAWYGGYWTQVLGAGGVCQ